MACCLHLMLASRDCLAIMFAPLFEMLLNSQAFRVIVDVEIVPLHPTCLANPLCCRAVFSIRGTSVVPTM